MANSKWILLISAFLLLGFAAGAQNIYLRHFTVNDGLPSNTVYDVYSDSKGYLWFGTDKGIARYNGTRFDYFTTSDGLPDNNVFCFKEDKQHRLWISTYGGALCYFKEGKFYTAVNTPSLKLPFKSIQKDISVASDSSVIILYKDPEYKFVSIKGDKVRLYDFGKLKALMEGGLVKIVRIPHKGYKLLYPDMWVEIDDSGRFLRRYRSTKLFTLVSTRTQDRQLLYAEHNIYDADEKRLQEIPNIIEPYNGYLIAHWEPQRIFICTSNGVFMNNDIHLLSQSHVVALAPDIEGNYWIATINEGGAYWLNKDLLAVREYKGAYNGKVIYVKKIGNKIFFATDNGDLHCLANGKSRPIYINKQAKEKVGQGRILIPLVTDEHDYFFFGRENYYWIKGINSIKRGVSKRKVLPSFGPAKYVAAVNNDFYYLQRDSVSVIPLLNGPFHKYLKDWKERIPAGGLIFSFALDPKNNIWIATSEGLRKLYDKKILTQPQINFTFRQFGFYNDYMVGYTDKNLLLLTRNYESSNPNIDTLQSNNAIWNGIYPIDTNHIIIAANNYYCLLTFSSRYTKGYKISFIENAFIPTHAEHITADTANCYFFKDNTITTIRKSVLFDQRPPPRVLLTKIKTQHKTFPIESIVSIPYTQARDIRIEFDYIAYNASKINCQYSITTDNTESWKDISGEMAINLLNIGYGQYQIKLRAKTLTSDYSIVRHFILIVERPFWARWWFISLCILCFLIIISAIAIIVIKYLLRKKQEKYKIEMKVRKSEFKALNALMNPHFIFNSLNNIQNLINKKNVDKANKYLVIFSKLVRQNMHNIEREYISLDKEIELVSNYLKLEQLRFKEFLNYDIVLEVPEAELEEIVIPALLLQPLVENAIKHGLQPRRSPHNYLLLHIYERDNVLFIEIHDNGVGFTRSRNRSLEMGHESFALNNIQQRIDYFNSLYSRKITFLLQEIMEGEAVKGTMAIIKITLD
jgi:hypothetical protein